MAGGYLMKYASIIALGAMALSLSPALAETAAETAPDLESIARVEAEVLTPGAEAGEEIGKYRFVLSFEPGEGREEALIRTRLERGGELARILDELSAQIALPQDVPVRFTHCGQPNAFWSPTEKDVTMCYELMALYNQGYTDVQDQFKSVFSWADQIEVLMGTTIFVLLHEIGHGMVDLFDLPVTGREEDSVDQFATFVLVNSDEEGDPVEARPSRYALLAGYFFEQLKPVGTEVTRKYWADTHSFGAQRNIDLFCLVLGSAPEKYGELILPGLTMVDEFFTENRDIVGSRAVEWLNQTDDLNLIPWQRAVGCGGEYARYAASWDYLTDTFMTPQPH